MKGPDSRRACSGATQQIGPPRQSCECAQTLEGKMESTYAFERKRSKRLKYRSVPKLRSPCTFYFPTCPAHPNLALPHQRRICPKPQQSQNRQKALISRKPLPLPAVLARRAEGEKRRRGEKVTQPHGFSSRLCRLRDKQR